MTTFDEIAASYIAEKRAIGYKMEVGERAIAKLCALHAEMGCPPDELPRELAEAWAELRPGESEATRLHRVCHVRCLGEYMSRMGYEAYVMPGKVGHVARDSYNPYIFTGAEVSSLLAAADGLAGPDPACRNAQSALIVRLLYACGLRIGEACGLLKDDVDLAGGMLTVRKSKNDKDRVVPMHPSVTERMRAFERAAQIAHPQYPGHGLFWSLPEGRRPSRSTVYDFFRRALWAAGIPHGGRGKGPRLHDLRFTFACHRLRKWVEEGSDVGALMPYLAVYMGHADTSCTEYYLRLTAESFPGMLEKIERACGWVVPS